MQGKKQIRQGKEEDNQYCMQNPEWQNLICLQAQRIKQMANQ